MELRVHLVCTNICVIYIISLLCYEKKKFKSSERELIHTVYFSETTRDLILPTLIIKGFL